MLLLARAGSYHRRRRAGGDRIGQCSTACQEGGGASPQRWRVVAGLSPGPSLAQERQWHALPVAGGTNAIAAAAGHRDRPPGLARSLRGGATASRAVGRGRRRRRRESGERAGRGGGRALAPRALHLAGAPAPRRPARRPARRRHRRGSTVGPALPRPGGARRAHARRAGRRSRCRAAAVRPSRGRAGRLRRALPRAGGRGGGAGRRGGGAGVGQAGGPEPPGAAGVPDGPARGERGTPGLALRLGGPPRPATPALRARAVPAGGPGARGRPALAGRGLRP